MSEKELSTAAARREWARKKLVGVESRLLVTPRSNFFSNSSLQIIFSLILSPTDSAEDPKNIVVSCYDANSLKSDKSVDDFIRHLYKEGLLSLPEFNELKQKIQDLQEGNLVPIKQSIIDAIHS